MKKNMVIHIEEMLAGNSRGLCHAPLEFDEKTGNIPNMTTKMALATCPKCIEIRKARVAQAVETRKMMKEFRARLAAEEAQDATANRAVGGDPGADFIVRYSGTDENGKQKTVTQTERRESTFSVCDVQETIEEGFMNGNISDAELGFDEIESLRVVGKL
jgi:hypothetical protein